MKTKGTKQTKKKSAGKGKAKKVVQKEEPVIEEENIQDQHEAQPEIEATNEEEIVQDQSEVHLEDKKSNDSGSEDEQVAQQNEKLQRLEKLKLLRKRMAESTKENRKEVNAEHQRNKSNPRLEAKLEKKRLEAERLQARMDAEERGEDYERTRFWDYTAEAAENWEEKEKEKQELAENGFTDHMQLAERKYKRLVSKLKPNLSAYNHQKRLAGELELPETRELALASNLGNDGKTVMFDQVHPRPNTDAVDRLAQHVHDEVAKRAKFSKIRPIKEDEDVTYINDRNAHFNRKIARAFDKYTKDIKDSFERGTAL